MFRSILLLTLAVLATAACPGEHSSRPAPSNAAPSTVVVSTYPLAYFARAMADDLVEVAFPVHPDANPARWRPHEGDLELLRSADLVLTNGATYELWTQYITLPGGTLHNTSAGFRDDYIVIPDAIRHSHGDGTWHTHDATASVTWLDPIQALQQAESVRSALVRLLPAEATEINRRHGELDAELRELHRLNLEATRPLREVHLLAAGHDLQYFARRYRLSMSFPGWDTARGLDGESWAELDAITEQRPAHHLIWSGEPTAEALSGLEERGITVIPVDIAAHEPRDGDFLDAMASIREALKRIDASEPAP